MQLLVQHTGYYPYGEPWRESLGQPYLFEGKERMRDCGLNEYDFIARRLYSPLCIWTAPDKLALQYSTTNPFVYCAGNPVKFTDPSGCVIEGVSKEDAKLAVEDFRAMFPGEIFADFRKLIVQSGKKQNGKSFAPISEDALSTAFKGVTLNDDQQALVDMVVNTINSDKIHKVEYIKREGVLSRKAEKAFLPRFDNEDFIRNIPLILERNGGFPVRFIDNEGGDGATTPIENGSYSLIFIDGKHPNGRAVTTGHEIIGHGRSLSIGRGDENQHVDAIQTENLILRVMGIPYINTGEKHKGNGAFPECSNLPSFR